MDEIRAKIVSSIDLDAIKAKVSSIDVDVMKQWAMDLVEIAKQPVVYAFVPQLLILLVMSLKLHKDLPLCCLLQTICFVAFNKVCVLYLRVLLRCT